jgi:hypothetical protein
MRSIDLPLPLHDGVPAVEYDRDIEIMELRLRQWLDIKGIAWQVMQRGPALARWPQVLAGISKELRQLCATRAAACARESRPVPDLRTEEC